ncbi:MAG: T9SS type A sorting domain-containing protein [Bacteroidia bacterium]|nr:T9SS type A sorting domain-containing protein [Bacteroidia bacterium]
MKNYLYIILAVFMTIAAMLPNSAQGQVCTPDTQFTTTGIFPVVLPPVCNNSPVNEVITVVIPTDTAINIPPFGTTNVIVDSIVINNITDLPPGVSYSCSPASCTFNGGTSSCVLFSGTPTMSGTYLVDFDVTLHVVFAGNSIAFPTVLTDTIEIVVNDELTANITTTDADCGVPNGTATVSVTSMAAATSYLWSNGDTTASVTGLAAGSYNVDVTDANGCIKSFTAVIGSAANDLMIDSAASVIGWAGCLEDNGGAIAPIVTGSGAPFSFSWSTSSVDSIITNLTGGTYTLTVTDANGCVKVQTYEVVAPDTLTAVLDGAITNVDCNGEATGAAAILGSGGAGTLTYLWNTTPAQTTPAATGLPAGMYMATVTDENSCTKTVDITITQSSEIQITVNVIDETAGGANDGAISTTVAGGVPPYTYNWNGNDTTADLTALAPGNYDLIVTDSLGCSATQMVTVLSGPGSIENLSGVVSLKLFPNPNQGNFTLSMELEQPKALEVSLLNMHGQLIAEKNLGTQSYVNENFTGIQSGMYLLQIKAGEEATTMKIFVE